jgi:hypothetical protein
VQGYTVTIDGTTYKLVKHRAMGGQVKQLTVKRGSVRRQWLVFRVMEKAPSLKPARVTAAASALYCAIFRGCENRRYARPQFYKQGLCKTKCLGKARPGKQESAKGYQQA